MLALSGCLKQLKKKLKRFFREISLGWQKLGVDTRTSWVVGGGRILSHRDGQELVVRDFRRWREVQE